MQKWAVKVTSVLVVIVREKKSERVRKIEKKRDRKRDRKGKLKRVKKIENERQRE